MLLGRYISGAGDKGIKISIGRGGGVVLSLKGQS